MVEALWLCMDNFKTFWGQRLVNSLRAVHSLVYSDKDLDAHMKLASENDDDDESGGSSKPDWLNQLFNNQGD